MRLAALAVPVVALAALAAGCGSSTNTPSAPAGASALACTSDGGGIAEVRVTGVGCDIGRAVAAGWSRESGCASPAGASRFACTVRGYRCLGTATDRGVAVGCAQPNRSIAFTAKRP